MYINKDYKEMEVKVLNTDLDLLEDKLINLGAKFISKEFQKNIILDDDIKNIQKNDAYLRIREIEFQSSGDKKVEFTYKKNLDGENKIRENLEINIDIKVEDKDNLLKLLKELGYDIVSIGYKNRKSYEYDGIRFDLDIWDEETYPFPYMEIEVKSKKDIKKAIKLLDIDDKNITTESIEDLKNKL